MSKHAQPQRTPPRSTRFVRATTLLAFSAVIAASAGCDSGARLPDKSSQEYGTVVAAFYAGLAALQVGDDARADSRLADVTRLAPGEPAGWANWAALALRQRNFDAAAQRLERARDLAPQDARVYNLLGILESQRGRSAQAIANLQKAVQLDPHHLRATYALAQEIERQGDKNSEAEGQQLMQKILASQPENLAALLDLSRLAARRGDRAGLQSAVARMSTRTAAWPVEVQEQFAALRAAAEGDDLRAAATRTSLLRKVLWRVPQFRRSFSALKAPPGEDVEPFTRFVRLDTPPFKVAAADTAIRFDAQPLANLGGKWRWIGAIQLGGAGAAIAAAADGHKLQLTNGGTLVFPGGPSAAPPSPEGILQVDFNYDFKIDLVLAGAGGVRLFRQEDPGKFIDETPRTGLPKDVINGRYTGAWAADIEADGDLDIALGTNQGLPVVLRNNGDGTFGVIHPFAGVHGLRHFVWADLDGDGTPDAAIVDAAGRLHVFINERQGQFRERAPPQTLATIKTITAADANNDGVLDVLAAQSDGALLRISVTDERQGRDLAEVARIPPSATSLLAGEVRLRVADLDNNGAVDLYLAAVTPVEASPAGALVWLRNEKGAFTLLDRPAGPALAFDAADLNGDGKLDLLGLAADGSAVQAINRGARNYHWEIIRPRAAQTFGDQRINPFGVGGEVEIRSGMLLQKQLITLPQVHFGLGEQTATDVVRVLWPNGAVRGEFELKADQEIVAEQRLKGSCPFLFAYDGKQMVFVKDAIPWGSAIGLRINTLGSAQIAATEEWYRIRRDQLLPRDGFYDLRFTAELWEVYYYDHLALMTVDHPVGTEVFVDERFVIPPAKLAVTAVATRRKIARALDDTGVDVTEIVSKLDGKAVDSFGHGQYQGVTRDHWLEVDLGDDAPANGPLYLIAHGSIYPTDSSINVAMTQGERWRAHGLSQA
jgi:Tfp pilus assembly protein PilF